MSKYRDGVKVKRDGIVYDVVRHGEKSFHSGEPLFSLVNRKGLSPAGYFTPSYMDETFVIVNGQKAGW